ncbi:unnamed protein product [Candida verbasci]|uniref:Uncharacterized protein n=1 Tax=Candida verbasci TaxID=1227364 RepID=A0A9W4U0F8_9ASCO|nr:unnamed protein product [Candida verbasci]
MSTAAEISEPKAKNGIMQMIKNVFDGGHKHKDTTGTIANDDATTKVNNGSIFEKLKKQVDKVFKGK